MSSAFLLVVAWCLTPTSTLGQATPTNSIAGRVLEAATGSPIPDVVVSIEGSGRAVLTDDQGRYRLVDVRPGPGVLRGERIGFAVARLPITVPVAGALRRDIELSVSALRMADITVTADAVGRAEGELGTASVIEREAIEHVTATSLAGVLQLVPGIATQPPGLNDIEQIALRSVPTSPNFGVSSGDAGVSRTSADLAAFGTLIVLDGVPLSNNANLQSLGPRGTSDGQPLGFSTTANGGIDLRRIPASTIERVEVIRGVPSVRYGDLTQGAIIVETRAASIPPILEGKFDEGTLEGSLVGGRSFGGPGQAATLSFDLARTRTEPGVSDDQTTRVAGQFAHRATIGRNPSSDGVIDPKLTLDTRFDVFSLYDDRPENPDIRPGRASESRDTGIRLSERARLRLGSESHLSLTASVSRTDQETTSRAPKVSGFQPFTSAREEGRNTGFYIGGFYTAEIELDGTPWLGFGRLEWENRRGWFGANHQIIAGAELRSEWNNGAGFQFDPQFPPSIGFNGVAGYDRTRTFDAIPGMATSALYVGDRITTSVAGWSASLQAGLRIDLLHEGESWFSAARDHVIQPRLNLELAPRDGLRLRAGWGRTGKAPALGDLYPPPQYFDLVNVNYFANDPAERLAVLTTFIRDPENPELGLSVGTKAEAGVEFDVADGTIALVAFRDRIDGGVGIAAVPDFITRDHFALSDSTPGSGMPPEILLPPLFTDSVPVLVTRPGNILDQVNRGFELTAALPQIEALSTQLNVTGSWVDTKTTSEALAFGSLSAFTEFQLSESQVRTPYWEGFAEGGESMIFLYRLIHHQRDLGLVVTLAVQHNAVDEFTDFVPNDTLSFAGYMTRAGELVPVPEERRGDPEFADLRVTRAGSRTLEGPAPDWMAHLQVSKTLPLDGQLRVWVFNLSDRRGRPFEPGQVGRLYPPVRFGVEVTFPTAKFFDW